MPLHNHYLTDKPIYSLLPTLPLWEELRLIETPQHLIPDFNIVTQPTLTTTTKAPISAINLTITPANMTVSKISSKVVSASPVLGLSLAVIVVILTLAVLLLFREMPQEVRSPRPWEAVKIRYGDKYVYKGRKLLIRKLYLNFLRLLERLGMWIPSGYTPREVAEEASRRGINISSRISSLYYRFMYRPEDPPEDVINEINDIERNLKGEGNEG
jgi:hypothetical protein